MIADLSRWQGEIDFCKLSKVVDFVILKVQSGYTKPDPKYKEYVAGCKENNIRFGTYAYFQGVSIPDAIAEAKNGLNLMDADSQFFILDIEEKTCNDLISAGQAFIDYLKNKGVKKVGLYSGENFYNQNKLSDIKVDFTWIANYGVNDGQQHSKPKTPCDLWQYTSAGKIDGIETNVDLNTLNGSKTLEWFTGKVAAPEHPIIAQVKVIASALNVRKGPGPNYPVICVLTKGKILNVTGNLNDWHEVIVDSHTKGYAFGNNGTYLELIRN